MLPCGKAAVDVLAQLTALKWLEVYRGVDTAGLLRLTRLLQLTQLKTTLGPLPVEDNPLLAFLRCVHLSDEPVSVGTGAIRLYKSCKWTP